ncbi:MAG: mercuric reductase [Thermoleophilia bacterium]
MGRDSTRYDAVVIGSGQGGNPLAVALAKAGWKTAMVEREHVGGTCINVGCTPTKTMVASARVAYTARRAAEFGVDTGLVGVDMPAVLRRKNEIVASWRASGEDRLAAAPGLDLMRGEASFSAPHELEVRMNVSDEPDSTRSLTAEHIFINVGARPTVPSFLGLDGVPYLDSTTVMELDVVPEHLVVLGGGYVGVEFGQMFRRFGSEVTIVQRGDALLAKEDADVSEAVAAILREDGVRLVLEAKATRTEVDSDGSVALTVDSPEGRHTIRGSHLLVAVGRTLNTDRLNLAAAGIETDRHGTIPVNERLETGVPGVYALGDVKGGPAFTHISYDDFRILRTNLLEGGSASTVDRVVPYVVFLDPQLGRVGLSETEARQRGLEIRVAKMPMEWVARALEVDESRGLMKVVVDAKTDLILGCAVLGMEGGEIASLLQVAMMGGLTAAGLREATFAHPTLAESLNSLFGSWVEQSDDDPAPKP